MHKTKNYRDKSYRDNLCRDYNPETRFCPYGSKCKYDHPNGIDPKRDVSETIICTSFLNGTCRFGSKCWYAHGSNKLRKSVQESYEKSTLKNKQSIVKNSI